MESVKGFRRLFMCPEDGSVLISRIDMIVDPVIGMVGICRGRFAELGVIQLGIDAACGGWHLQFAWSTGVLAGRAAAKEIDGV